MNIDLTKILKDCPKGTKLYSTIHGVVKFMSAQHIDGSDYPITVRVGDSYNENFTADGKLYSNLDGECLLFSSKEQRDWSKFKAPWHKKERFDPTTLKPFDKVLIKSDDDTTWVATLFSHIIKFHDTIIPGINYLEYVTSYCTSSFCIPYNDETKHLVGTTEEAPEFYRYWED